MIPYIVEGMSIKDLLRFVVLACIFATPFICLYVAESMFFPFITGKNFAFRILVEIMLGAWMLLMFIDATYRPKFSWVLAAAGTFLAVIAVADFHGVNPFRSFWSNYERMEGLITHAHLFLYFIIAGSVMATEEMWKWFWRVSIGASLIVGIYAISEYNNNVLRLDATFGNATYLAIYALFNTFLAAFLYVRDGAKNQLRWLYLVVAAVNIAMLYFTQTRGTLLGLIGGTVLAFFLVALFDKERPERKKYALAGVLAFGLLIAGFIAIRHTSVVQSHPTLARLGSISLKDPTTISRFMIWQMSWEGFKEKPILGWGQDNFLYVFAKHYNPKMWNQEPWFDRSHDVFFDWLIAGGSLGLLSYLSMFGAALYYLWFAKRHHFSIVERSILTGLLAGYFVHNIFVFDNLTSYITFFGLLAYLHTLNADSGEEVSNKKVKKGESLELGDVAIAAVVISAVTFGVIYFVNIRNINANVNLINSIRPNGVLVDDGKGGKRIAMEDLMDDALFGTGEAREQLAQLAMQTLDPRVPPQIREQFFNLATKQFDIELSNDPDNLRIQAFAAMFYARFGHYDMALPHFEKAIALSPSRQSTYIDLSTMYVAQQNYAEAERVTKIAYDLDPANPDAELAYAVALIYQHKPETVNAILATHIDTPIAYDTRLINAYGVTGYYAQAAQVINEKIARGYATGRDYFSLAGVYAETGKKAEAIAAVQKGVSLDSSLKDQGDQLIQQISGKSPTIVK